MNRKIEVYCFLCGPKELTDEQVASIIKHNGKMMKKFGYIDDKENPV